MKLLKRSQIICLTFMTILYLQNTHIQCSAEKIPVCNTPECKELGAYYAKSLSALVHPCRNFYDYVCYGWKRKNPRPKEDVLWSVDKLMALRVTEKLRKLLEDKRPTGVASFEQAKELYKACMNLPFMEKAGPRTVRDIMKKVGNWPMFLPENQALPSNLDWSTIDNKYIALTGESAFLEYTVEANVLNGNRIILLIKRPHSPYGMLKRYVPWEGTIEKCHYKNYLNQVIKSVAPTSLSSFKSRIDKDLNDVINFRIELDKVLKAAAKDQMIELMTIAELQEFYNKGAGSKNTAMIDWFAKCSAMYKRSKNPYGMPIKKTDMIDVEKNYFTLLAQLLGRTSKTVIVNHIHLYFAERNLKLDSDMEDELNRSGRYGNYPHGGIRYSSERWRHCVRENNMAIVLGRMYLKDYFSTKEVDNVRALIDKAKALLKMQISEAEWVKPDAKTLLKKKVDDITSQVGFPDWYLDPTLTASKIASKFQKDDINPLVVDAYFVRKLNKLYLTAGFLQPPMYNPNVSYVIDYATTVAMIGQQLYHSLDREGLDFIPPYFQSIEYWDRQKKQLLPMDVQNKHDERMRCFKLQYNRFRWLESQRYGVPFLNTADTSDEDMADTMALKLAYKGYKQKLKENKGHCPVLPGFEKKGCEALFFIAFGNNFCDESIIPAQRAMLQSDRHSLAQIRLNGAVANMKEFSQAFHCDNTDRLQHRDGCDLWKD